MASLMMSCCSRAAAKRVVQQQQRQLRCLSTLPSRYWEKNEAETNKEEHKEVHHSFSLEETLENLLEMQRIGSDDSSNSNTFERVVRGTLFTDSAVMEKFDSSQPGLQERSDSIPKEDEPDSHCKGRCHVCGRRDEPGELCDMCSAGMTVCRFVPDTKGFFVQDTK